MSIVIQNFQIFIKSHIFFGSHVCTFDKQVQRQMMLYIGQKSQIENVPCTNDDNGNSRVLYLFQCSGWGKRSDRIAPDRKNQMQELEVTVTRVLASKFSVPGGIFWTGKFSILAKTDTDTLFLRESASILTNLASENGFSNCPQLNSIPAFYLLTTSSSCQL